MREPKQLVEMNAESSVRLRAGASGSRINVLEILAGM
jgi:hypothetical protein